MWQLQHVVSIKVWNADKIILITFLYRDDSNVNNRRNNIDKTKQNTIKNK